MTSEKISRWAFALGGIIIAFVGGLYVFPYIIRFAELGIEAGFKMLVLGVMLSIIGGIVAILLSPQFQTSVWYMYMGWVDSIALRVVKANPIARVKAYVTHYLEPMQVRAGEVLTRAVARETSAKARVNEVTKDLETAKKRAEYCLTNGSPDQGKTWTNSSMRAEFGTQSAKIRTMEDALTRLKKRLQFQQGCVSVLRELQTVIANYIEVTRFNVEMMVQEYESAGEMAEGSNDVKGMLGKSEKTKFYNLAAEQIQAQTDQWMAEVEGVMGVIQAQINTGNIDKAIGEEDLIRELTGRVGSMSAFAENQRQLSEGGDATLLSTAKSKVLDGVVVDRGPKSISSPSEHRFGRLMPPKQ